jgi:hypothetical protein
MPSARWAYAPASASCGDRGWSRERAARDEAGRRAGCGVACGAGPGRPESEQGAALRRLPPATAQQEWCRGWRLRPERTLHAALPGPRPSDHAFGTVGLRSCFGLMRGYGMVSRTCGEGRSGSQSRLRGSLRRGAPPARVGAGRSPAEAAARNRKPQAQRERCRGRRLRSERTHHAGIGNGLADVRRGTKRVAEQAAGQPAARGPAGPSRSRAQPCGGCRPQSQAAGAAGAVSWPKAKV